jgi:PAS domain S-box-containing protein
MADAVPQIVWITDGEGRTEFFNKQWSDYTGVAYEPSTAAQVAADYVHPEDAAATVAAFEKAKATGTPFDVEHRIRSAGGQYRWFLVRAEPHRDAAGAIVRWFGSSTDIHDRRLAEEELRNLNATLERRVAERTAERNMLATIVETTDVLIMGVDLDYNILAINPANADEFERIYGVRPKAGDNILELLAGQPEQQAQVRAGWGRGLRGEHLTFVEDFGDPDRVRPYYEVKFRPLTNEAGEQIGAYHFVTDVTDRLRKEARLEEAETARRASDALYRAYFVHSPEALFVIAVEADGSFLVEQVNPAHEAGLGFKLDEVRGKRLDEILPAELAKQVLGTYRYVLETGEILQYRETYELEEGPTHWDTSIVPVRDAEGRIARLIGSSRNVTRQVIAEEALRQSQKLESMGQLTGGVAHDFNNLLTPIIGSLDMLQRRGVGSEREQRLISGAVQSAERAKTLVQRLLAFARRQPLQPVPVELGKLVEGMADLVASTSGPRVRVQVDVASDLPPVTADPNQLEMAILNLAVNSRDAMPDGGALTVAAKAEAVGVGHHPGLAPGDYVRLSVSDTGSGMDAETARRAIEPFFSTKGVGKGTGLGLSMVHGLAAQLRGAMTIDSRRGVGTTVKLWLPVASAIAPSSEPVDGAVEVAASGTALLVDDEELVRASTSDMLSDLGYAVVEAGSAEEALRLLEDGLVPDVVVTDHLMPRMTGTDLARRLRERVGAPKILVISGYAEDDGISPDLPRLTKPFRQADLALSLAALIQMADSLEEQQTS